MVFQNAQNLNTTEKFQNAELLWFWFIYCKSVQTDFIRNRPRAIRKVCELLDVEILVTKLYLSGQLTEEQLEIMKKFGDKRRAPHQYIFEENHEAALWNKAMNTLQKAAQEKGWIE